MALNQIVDKRSDALVYEGGSDLLQLYVDAAAALALPGFAPLGAGWYTLSYLQGGSWGPERESEEIKSESGHKVRDRVTSNKFIFANGAMQTDDDTIDALDYFEENSTKARYFSPTLPSTPAAFQVVGYFDVKVRKENWTIDTNEGALHVRAFTLDGTEDTDGNLKVIETIVDIDDEASWPSTLDAFLTDEASWPT